MDWQEFFSDLFFNTWNKAGLPNPIDYGEEYVKKRERAVFINRYIEEPFESNPALESHLLNSIYGFGSLHGKMFGRLLNLNEKEVTDAADWCGRFNLGISLFDYLSDETVGGIKSVISLDVFQPFTQNTKRVIRELNSAEKFLNNLTVSVLHDSTVHKNQDEPSSNLMQLLGQLFEAQVFLSNQKLTNTKDLAKIKHALFLKSAEPFRVMAEYVLYSACIDKPKIREQARVLGTAIGVCYWLIDDAKDIWIDLKAGDWNVFLQLIAQQNPNIFNNLLNDSSDEISKEICNQNQNVQLMISKAINNLVKSTKKLDVSEKIVRHQMGLLGAALWHWSKF